MPFNFTNKSATYQHSMNYVLFIFFNNFVQASFNDIFIYNKICKEYIEYICKIFKELIDVDL